MSSHLYYSSIGVEGKSFWISIIGGLYFIGINEELESTIGVWIVLNEKGTIVWGGLCTVDISIFGDGEGAERIRCSKSNMSARLKHHTPCEESSII